MLQTSRRTPCPAARCRRAIGALLWLAGGGVWAEASADPMALEFRQQDHQRTVRSGKHAPTTSSMFERAPGPPLRSNERQTMTLEFRGSNYFSPGNIGHFAIGIRGDSLKDVDGDQHRDVLGRGVVLGNVTQYPAQPGQRDCGPAHQTNSLVFESFWAGGNCVFGGHPPPGGHPILRDGVWYRLQLWSGPQCNRRGLFIGYALAELRPDKRWKFVASHIVPDDSRNTSPSHLSGWFIGEVSSRHDWTMRIRGLKVTRTACRCTPQDGAARTYAARCGT